MGANQCGGPVRAPDWGMLVQDPRQPAQPLLTICLLLFGGVVSPLHSHPPSPNRPALLIIFVLAHTPQHIPLQLLLSLSPIALSTRRHSDARKYSSQTVRESTLQHQICGPADIGACAYREQALADRTARADKKPCTLTFTALSTPVWVFGAVESLAQGSLRYSITSTSQPTTTATTTSAVLRANGKAGWLAG
ncbi:hypothetical protein DdX_11269 [Ditylenchus destructor]|uniref:Uncharacterized protein n=1 Tax=Ditylenchus destructor TaxID=166010 RepID=A0AAD4MX71_9BILA|nr:hypothetical protein DdX_11269 [Ditylenchus destructor]